MWRARDRAGGPRQALRGARIGRHLAAVGLENAACGNRHGAGLLLALSHRRLGRAGLLVERLPERGGLALRRGLLAVVALASCVRRDALRRRLLRGLGSRALAHSCVSCRLSPRTDRRHDTHGRQYAVTRGAAAVVAVLSVVFFDNYSVPGAVGEHPSICTNMGRVYWRPVADQRN